MSAGGRHGKCRFGALERSKGTWNGDVVRNIDDEQFVEGPAASVARRPDKRTGKLAAPVRTAVTVLSHPAIGSGVRNLVARGRWIGLNRNDEHGESLTSAGKLWVFGDAHRMSQLRHTDRAKIEVLPDRKAAGPHDGVIIREADPLSVPRKLMAVRSAAKSTHRIRRLRIPGVCESQRAAAVAVDEGTKAAMLFILVVWARCMKGSVNEDHLVTVVGETRDRDSGAEGI